MNPVRFNGVYQLPSGLSQDGVERFKERFQDRNPYFYLKTGGVPLLLLDDSWGNHTREFKPRLEKARSRLRLHFEPNGILGFLYNAALDKLLNPIGRLVKIEDELTPHILPIGQAQEKAGD